MRTDRLHASAGAWPLIVAILVATAIWMSKSGLSFNWESAALTLCTCIGLEALALFYRIRRPEPRISATLQCLAQIIAFSSCAAVLSYTVASTSGPLWDATFFAWDQAIGLDWRAYLAVTDQHPLLGMAYTLAYRSLMLQTMLVVTLLGLTGRLRALQEFVWAFVIAGTTTVLISGLMPAMANFVYLRLSPSDFPNLQPAASYVHVAHMTNLRNGVFKLVSLNELEGIITFPSFHAALGVLFLRALWVVPWVRAPAFVINMLLIASTPIDGGHYFVDVIAGAVIAILAICFSRCLVGANAKDPARSHVFDAGIKPGSA